ncbi:MBL fold metallo-hydrolase [Prolixibacteraceae bacterium Z1-6]|uniref:MBL fold metallo-hydrolase n=1 Tax=Draconibacterium aestuarii TaxID=2998507 RepID=A0A9X3F508_9BACT|nr:MBL fold metallo-hydrolase [Prolixibacteraceae bacterium Z1-6]
MPGLKIIQKRIGFSNSTLIANGNNSILVDTGVKGNMKKFGVLIREAGLQPENIKLIVLTHTHYDHTGNLLKLVKYTKAKVLVHKNEFENLKNGFTPIPVGNGKYSHFISELGRKVHPKYASPKPFTADLINEYEFDLNTFGLDGKIISTPGHTNGSQSVLIDKYLISGDTFLNMKNGRIFPPFADEPRVLLETWEKLFSQNIKTIYPGHGKRFKIEKAMPDFERWQQKLSS